MLEDFTCLECSWNCYQTPVLLIMGDVPIVKDSSLSATVHQTRKHLSRMRYRPLANRNLTCFGHQMSLPLRVGRGSSEQVLSRSPVMATRCHQQGGQGVAMSDVCSWGQGCWELGRGRQLYTEVQCIMGNGHMGPSAWTEWQTDTCENITFPQLHWRVVITHI